MKGVIPDEYKDIIEKNFMLISPSGERKFGVEAFIEWNAKRGFDVSRKAKEYNDVLKKVETYKKDELISGIDKMRNTFEKVFLDEVFYLEFYSIEVFGKTKLGQMLLYSKQSQDKKLIKEVVDETKERVNRLIEKYNIDAIGFVPPSVKREVQFMKEVERRLNIGLPTVKLEKIKGEVIVPQKTLNRLSDRIENSKQIRFVSGVESKKYDTVLLIDDALGSGATLNEVARQIKKQKAATKVIGMVFTGSFSGFDVISEV